jgi:4'-phosphopantetheinyl transferase
MKAISARHLLHWPSPESDVQLWIAHLDSLSPYELEACLAVLDSSERARAARFQFQRDRQHYAVTRGLLRRLLGAILDQSPSEIALAYGERGKPMLSGNTGARRLHFNLSHSSGCAIFALAWDREIGVDLEAVANLSSDLDNLAARILSARELVIWRALPNDRLRCAEFLRAWTRKEACAKAVGEGLGIDVRTIEVVRESEQSGTVFARVASAVGHPAHWVLHDLSAPAGFAAALAIRAP